MPAPALQAKVCPDAVAQGAFKPEQRARRSRLERQPDNPGQFLDEVFIAPLPEFAALGISLDPSQLSLHFGGGGSHYQHW